MSTSSTACLGAGKKDLGLKYKMIRAVGCWEDHEDEVNKFLATNPSILVFSENVDDDMIYTSFIYKA